MKILNNDNVNDITMENIKENKYKEGEVVCEKSNPHVRLIVRRYLNRIYYCKFQWDPQQKELALFEREIESVPHVGNLEY